MTIEDLTHVIANVGFPIVACIFMAKQNEKLQKSIDALNNTLTSIDKRVEVLEYNTLKNRRDQDEKE